MPESKDLTQLPTVTDVQDADLFYTVRGSGNFSLTGAGMRSSLLEGVLVTVSSDDYGMVGDSATDNTTAFQNALTATAASASKVLLIRAAAGTYNFSDTVTVPFGVTIQGETNPGGDVGGYSPWDENPFKARLKFTGTVADALFLPQSSSNQFFDFELAGSGTTVGTGLVVGNAMFFSADTNTSTSLTNVRLPLAAQITPGLIVTNNYFPHTDIPVPVTATGTLTSGSPTFTVSSATGLANGMAVSGTGIPLGTTMTISGTTVTLSANATASGSQTITFSTAVVSYNSGTGTLVMSNAALGTHAGNAYAGFFALRNPLYPNGTNYPEFAGQRALLRNVYIHDFGVNLSCHYLDGLVIDRCNFGNGHFSNLVLENNFDSKIESSYVGGSGTHDYPNSFGIHIIQSGDGLMIQNTQINQCGTGIFATGAVCLTAINIGFEFCGTPTLPQIDLHDASSLWGNSLQNIALPYGTTPVRLSLNSQAYLFNPASGSGVQVTGTLTSSSATVSAMSPSDTANIYVGAVAIGTGIPDLTFVTAVASTSVTLSNTVTASATELIDFVMPIVQAQRLENVNVLPSAEFRPIALVDENNVVTELATGGHSADSITHGDFGSAVASLYQRTIQSAICYSNLSRTTTTTLADDPVLIIPSLAIGKYGVQIIFLTANASNAPGVDVKLVFTGSLAGTLGGWTGLAKHSDNLQVNMCTPQISNAGLFAPYNLEGATFGANIIVTADYEIDVTSSGDLKIQWCQNASSADVTLRAIGSKIIVTPR